MAYKVIILYQLYMPSYFLGTFTEYPYLSENAWEVTVNFKDNIITLINSAATSCPPQATASDLARKILEHYISSDLKGDQILKIVKAEIQ